MHECLCLAATLCGNFMSVKGYGPQACKVGHFRKATTARPTWVQIVLSSNSSFKAQVSSQAFWMASWLEGKPLANVHSPQSQLPHVLGSLHLIMCLIHAHGTLGNTLVHTESFSAKKIFYIYISIYKLEETRIHVMMKVNYSVDVTWLKMQTCIL